MSIIECECCGSWTAVSELPLNNICPVCLNQGSLFIQTDGHCQITHMNVSPDFYCGYGEKGA